MMGSTEVTPLDLMSAMPVLLQSLVLCLQLDRQPCAQQASASAAAMTGVAPWIRWCPREQGQNQSVEQG